MTVMTVTKLAVEIHFLRAAFRNKGYPEAGVSASIHEGGTAEIVLRDFEESDYGWRGYKFITESGLPTTAENMVVALSRAEQIIADFPEPAEQARREIVSELASLADKARKHGLEDDFINPLVETAKRLSKNALT